MDWSGLPRRISSQSKPTIKTGFDCFVHTDWAGIGKVSFAFSAINTAVKAGADLTLWICLQTGGVLRWRNSVE